MVMMDSDLELIQKTIVCGEVVYDVNSLDIKIKNSSAETKDASPLPQKRVEPTGLTNDCFSTTKAQKL